VSQAIRKHLRDFIAIVVLFLVAAGVAGYILSNQRFYLPKWVPLVGSDFVTYKAQLSTAQAVTPGQGQTVNIAGVQVGEVSTVELEDGRAVVELKIRRKYAKIYNDATILLRPKTGLKDMILELNPGTVTAGEIDENGTIPVSNTLPDVNPDQILAQLDGDTRAYLRILLGGAGQGLRGQGRNLSATLRRFEPTARDSLRVTRLLAQRRRSVARVIHNLRLLSQELASRDDALASWVQSSNAVFARFAAQEASIRQSLQLLPGTLEETQSGLGKAARLARVLGPTLQSLRPAARALGPTLVDVRPFLRQSIPILRDQLRPFTRQALPVVRDLRPTITDLSVLTPDLLSVARVVNYLLNELAYNPPGNGVGQEGFMFWTAWANHAANTIFATQDAHGPIRHGLVIVNCSSLGLLRNIVQTSPQLANLIQLANLPINDPALCPEATGAPG
jgi:phospholipid/cholesterol/gamma-HCH transport system substrate-binding protein